MVRALARLVCLAALVIVFLPVQGAQAQDLEPRAYSSSPIGTTFLVAGLVRSSGDVIFDLGVGATFGINAASSQANAAAEFLAHFFSPEAQASQVAGAGLDPAPVAIPADLLGDIDPRRERMIEQICALHFHEPNDGLL